MSEIKFPSIPQPEGTVASLLECMQAVKQTVELVTGLSGNAYISEATATAIKNAVGAISSGSTGGGGTTGDLTDIYNTINALRADVNAAAAAFASQLNVAQQYNAEAFADLNDQIAELISTLNQAQQYIDFEHSSNTALFADLRALISSGIAYLQTDVESIRTNVTGIVASIGDSNARVSTESAARATADTALAGRIDTVTATVGANTAGIITEVAARVTADQALAAKLETLTATVGLNSAAISTEQSARASADDAAATSISIMSAVVNGNKAAITNEAIARASADSTLASTIGSLTAQFGGNSAAITSESAVRANAIDALAGQIDTITSKVNGNSANITTEATTRASADAALAGRVDSISANVGNFAAAITNESVARVVGDSALVAQLNTLTAVAGRQRVYSQANAPTATSIGDLWIDTRNGNLLRYWDGVQWLASDDTRIAGTYAAAIAAVSTESSARTSADEALTSQVNSLVSLTGTNKASIVTEASTRSTNDNILAGLVSTLSGQVSTNSGKITEEAYVRAAADGVLSAQVNSVTAQSNAGTANGRIQMVAKSSALDGAVAEYDVRVSANGTSYASAGMTMQVFGDGTSRMLVDVGQFLVRAGSGSPTAAFVVASGQYVSNLLTPSSKLTAGLSANLLSNTTFNAGTEKWLKEDASWTAVGRDFSYAGVGGLNYYPVGGHALWYALETGATFATGATAHFANTQPIAVKPATRIQAYGLFSTHRCSAVVVVKFYDSAGTYLSEAVSNEANNSYGGQTLATFYQVGLFATVPTSAASCKFMVRVIGTNESYPYAFLTRPFLGLASENQTEYSFWSPGDELQFGASNKISDLNVATYLENGVISSAYIGTAAIVSAKIADAAITTAKISDAAITSAKITDANITTLKIAGNAVTIPISYWGPSSVFGNNTYRTLATATFTVPQATFMHILFTCGQDYAVTSATSSTVRMWLDGNGVGGYGMGTGNAQNVISLSYGAVIAAGEHTVYVDWIGPNANIATFNRSLFILGTLR
jgi:hypothetical protein